MYRVMLVLLLVACSEPSVSHAPELGSYAFHAEWNHPDFPGDPVVVDGELAVVESQDNAVSYTLTLFHPNGDRVNTATAIYSEANGWNITSASVLYAGTWVLFPFLRRTRDGYQCRGNAFSTTRGGRTLTCSYTYQG